MDQKKWDNIDAETERIFGKRTRPPKHTERRDVYGKDAFEKLFVRKLRETKDLH